MRTKPDKRPNFILVNEHLYHDFATFCKTYRYQNPQAQMKEQAQSASATHLVHALPDTVKDFILIDNQTGRIIR